VSIHAADVDGDGDTDIMSVACYDNHILWWENTNGNGTSWTEHFIENYFVGAWSIYSADMDGDGDMDVLGAAPPIDFVAWWSNNDGSGTDWTRHIVDSSFDGAGDVYAADINGDGIADVLGAAALAEDITWWDVNGFEASGDLTSSILDTDAMPEWGQISWTRIPPRTRRWLWKLELPTTPAAWAAGLRSAPAMNWAVI